MSGGARISTYTISQQIALVNEAHMADKKFLSWVGFKGENSMSAARVVSSEEPVGGSQSAISRIRELENQIAELRSRRDITNLTKEEFEILASETAMTLIKTAQSRESKALTTAQKIIGEGTQSAKELVQSAESKAKSFVAQAEARLAQAEVRGRKYLEAAQSEAESIVAEAAHEAEQLLSSKKREAGSLTSAAKREADELIARAVTDIADYRGWLSTAIAEASRLHKIQSQSLNAAEQAIEQTRNRLASAFEKLAALQGEIEANLTPENLPKAKEYIRVASRVGTESSAEAPLKKQAAKKPTSKKSSAKKVAKKPAAKRK
jgi:F0F1-type ATP synthase membrane subunit b/b'